MPVLVLVLALLLALVGSAEEPPADPLALVTTSRVPVVGLLLLAALHCGRAPS